MNGQKRNVCKLFVESQEERDHCEDQDVGGWIISWRDRMESYGLD
jgi:hypothetical protein